MARYSLALGYRNSFNGSVFQCTVHDNTFTIILVSGKATLYVEYCSPAIGHSQDWKGSATNKYIPASIKYYKKLPQRTSLIVRPAIWGSLSWITSQPHLAPPYLLPWQPQPTLLPVTPLSPPFTVDPAPSLPTHIQCLRLNPPDASSIPLCDPYRPLALSTHLGLG